MQILQAAAVNQHRIEIPEIDGWHITGKNLLHIAVKCQLLYWSAVEAAPASNWSTWEFA